MAGQAAKKAAKAKAAAQKLYLPVLAAVNLWYVAVRLYFRGEAANSHKFALIGCAVVYALTYPTACEASTQPTDSLASYFFDVMALTMIAQFFGALSDKAWYLLLVVPAFAAYKGIAWKFGGPAKPAAPPEPEEPAPESDPEPAPRLTEAAVLRMTVRELKVHLEERDLETKGLKAALQKRLLASLAE